MFPRHTWKERHLDAYTQTPVQGIQTGTVTAPEPLEHFMGPRWHMRKGHHGHHFLLPAVAIGLLQSLPASGPDSGPLPHFLSWPISLPK